MSEFACRIDKITDKIPNSPSPKRARRQVSLPYTPLPPSLPTRPGSPTPISSFLEGSPTAEDHATREELIERRTYFAQHLASTADLADAM